MKVLQATITSKGRITIPREIRQRFGLQAGDVVAFSLDETNQVTLRKITYPTIASLAGAAGRLEHPLASKEMLAIAREDALTSTLPD